MLKNLLPPIAVKLIQLFRTNQIIDFKGKERDSSFYDKNFLNSNHYSKHYTKSPYYTLWAILVDRILHTNITSILDIGCGPAQLALFLRDNGITNYLGIDFSHERIKQARKICPEFKFVEANVFKTDLFEKYHYECVICTELLEHIENDIELIQRILPGTHFWGTVPNFPYKSHVRFFKNSEEVFDRYGKYFKSLKVDTHLNNTTGSKYFIMDGII